MAEAEERGLTAAITEQELAMPVMPHIALSAEDLDKLYPALNPAEEVDDLDLDDESRDLTYTRGLKIASKIENDMAQLGRTRKEAEVRRHGAMVANKNDPDVRCESNEPQRSVSRMSRT